MPANEDVSRMLAAVDRGQRCELCGGSGVVRFGAGQNAPCIICEGETPFSPVAAASVAAPVAPVRRSRFALVLIAQAVTVLALAVAVGILSALAFAQWSDPRGGMPACATEDSSDCYWDADARGIVGGHSFTDRGGVVTYWENAR